MSDEEVVKRLGVCNTLQEVMDVLDRVYEELGFKNYDFNYYAWMAYKAGVLPYSIATARKEVRKLKGRIDDLLNTDFREDSDKWKELLRG